DQAASLPPPVEICHLPPGPGKGRTKTSFRPDSSDRYAIQRPSGEKTGSTSPAGVLRKTDGFPGFHPEVSSPSIGRIIRSKLDFGFVSKKARYFPLGSKDAGNCVFGLSVRR